MTYVVSLAGYVPSPRYDSVPWTHVTVGESATSTGSFSLIDTITLSPVDADPSLPQTRNFTTTHATLASGWYLVTFLDAAGNQEPTTPVAVAQAGAPVASSGSLVVSFTDINPPVRNDGTPWTSVQIAQAEQLAGPWVVIDTQVLSPVDADPAQPQARNLTTSAATLSEGLFRLTFFDARGATSDAIMQVEDDPSAIKPSLSELGSFMRARTVTAGSAGMESGTFTANTRPTGVEAQLLLDQAVSQVLMQVGADIPDRALQQARFMVLLYAAQLVELTFYRNEVSTGQSSYLQYEQLFKDGMAALTMFIADEGPAAAEVSFFSVPVMTASQARFHAYVQAIDPVTGRFDPSKLPVDLWYPRGPGGIPSSVLALYPWLGGDGAFGGGDFELADLESAD